MQNAYKAYTWKTRTSEQKKVYEDKKKAYEDWTNDPKNNAFIEDMMYDVFVTECKDGETFDNSVKALRKWFEDYGYEIEKLPFTLKEFKKFTFK